MKTRHVSRALSVLALSLIAGTAQAEVVLTNLSYTATREMYAEYNLAFAKYWRGKSGDSVSVKMGHGNSSTQASAVRNGTEADVVTLSLASDIDDIAASGFVPTNWQKRLGHNSAPYTSTIVFLVRRGNPKRIKDWSDLVRWGVDVVMSNPKTSGGARWSHLAAYGYALKQSGGNEQAARNFLKRLYSNNKVLEYTARGATDTFTKKKLGDVMVSWENEAFQAVSAAPDDFEMVVPSMSILAEPPVAVVDKVVDKRGTRAVAEAYINYLYTPEGQLIAGKYFYRPADPTAAAQYSKLFVPLKLFTVEELFGDWHAANKTHFSDGGVFDQVYDQYRNAS